MNIRLNLLQLSIAALLPIACDFPYQPTTFELPAIPSPFTSVDSIANFIGTPNVKIAYTMSQGSRTVWFIDFSQPSPVPVQLKKPRGKENLHADSPLMSPDGSFVAYFLTLGASEDGAYIQKLDPLAEPVLISANGTEPHWWTDSAENNYVIYSDQFTTPKFVAGKNFTFRQKVSLAGNGSIAGKADTIAPYPMNGGISADGRFLCTGYINGAFYQLPSGPLIPVNEGAQICNPSITPDTLAPDRMMFLNFAGPQYFSGNPFSAAADYPANEKGELPLHGVIYIVDGGNVVRDFIPLSLTGGTYDEQEWEDPEWSNRSGFIIALKTINKTSNFADAIVISNVGNGNNKKETLVVTPGKFKLEYTSTPYLWIGK